MISLPNPTKTLYTDFSSDKDMSYTFVESPMIEEMLIGQSFDSFKEQQDARNTIELNIRKYCLMLCDALLDNFKSRNSSSDYKFYIESGRKYHKLIMDANGSRSVHAFVDRKTGEVYKSASWKSPAKGVRFNLLLIEDREWLLENADWAGGYLYAR
jgi:hypothetical protein